MRKIPTDKEIIVENIKWLNKFIAYRDIEMDVKKGHASVYAEIQNRTIRRVLDFIDRDKESLQWLHDFLMRNGKLLEKDIFVMFFKIWSKRYKLTNNV
jgi:hypothetical protein